MFEVREPRPSRRPGAIALALLLAFSVGLSACGGGKGGGQEPKTPPPPPEPTPQEKIAQLEAQGQLPQLERLPLVAGIDIDNDGVRDDIAEHIRRTYTEPVQYRAAMQMARAFQLALLVDVHDAMELQRASEASNRAIVCAISAFPGSEGRITRGRMLRELESMTTNTKERLQAYLAYNKAQSGSVSVEPEGDTCE
jgi:hypothetical protein